MRHRVGGFTLLELLIVMAVIGVLASIILPAFIAARGRSKQAASAGQIQDFSIALKAFETDNGRYPVDESGGVPGGSGYVSNTGASGVITVLGAPGPKGIPYYQFRPEQIEGGRWMSHLKSPYRYRENASKVKPLPEGANLHSFDVWTRGYGDEMCDPVTSLPADASSCRNW